MESKESNRASVRESENQEEEFFKLLEEKEVIIDQLNQELRKYRAQDPQGKLLEEDGFKIDS